jgi:hypothetical protein
MSISPRAGAVLKSDGVKKGGAVRGALKKFNAPVYLAKSKKMYGVCILVLIDL